MHNTLITVLRFISKASTV